MPRRNGGRIASYVTEVAQLPLNYRDVMNAEKAGAFSVLLTLSTYIPVGNAEEE